MRRVFEWDEAKAASNLRKHGVSFEDARDVFDDPLRRTERDQIIDHETRWQTVGTVQGRTLLLVIHTWTERDSGGTITDVIRIISARRPTNRERRSYERRR